MLSDRDLATLLWGTVVVGVALLYPPTRKSLLGVIRALLASPIVTALGTFTLYLSGIVWLFAKAQLWRLSDWPITLLWLVGTAFIAVLTTKEAADKPRSLWLMLRDLVGVAIVLQVFALALQFIAETYTLPLLVEIALVPVIAFLAMLSAFAAREARSRPVAALANGVLAVIGLVFLVTGVLGAITHWRDFASIETARLFLLPLALSAALAPALFVLAHYMTLERIYSGSQFKITDPALRAYAMRRTLFAFGFQHKRIARFYHVGFGAYPDRTSIDAGVAQVQQQRRREANPPQIDPAEGWSPYLASRFLSADGLEASDYREFSERWSARSGQLDLDPRRFAAFLEYYVEGDENVARRLRLAAYVEPDVDGAAMRTRFADISATLITAAISAQAASACREEVERLQPFVVSVEGRELTFRIDEEGVPHGASIVRTLTIDCRAGFDSPD